jgi:hypothetical protein
MEAGNMRCFFMVNGHIQAVEVLTASSDDDAVSQAFALFRERGQSFDGFEVWDRARLIHRYSLEKSAPKVPSIREFLLRIVKRLTEIAADFPSAALELRLLIAEIRDYAAKIEVSPSA